MGESEDQWESGAGEPAEEWETDGEDRGATIPAFVLGGLVGMLVLGLVWVTTAVVAGDEPRGDSGVADQELAALSQASPSVDLEAEDADLEAEDADTVVIRRTRLDRCQAAAERLAAPLLAADPAMTQWEVHVGAMNKLVVGAITLQQASDFWESTRLGALRKIGRFDAAITPVRQEGLNCPVRSRLGRASQALRSCVNRVTADELTLQAARTAIARWEHHVHDMDRLRLGLISPATVSKRWLEDWQKGVREIAAYKSAAKAAARSGEC